MHRVADQLVAGVYVLLGVLALCAPSALRAQALRVTALDAGTGAPLANALLTAADMHDSAVATAATATSGTRLLRLPGAGTYRVTVRRIGQRPYSAAPVAVGAADTLPLTLRVPVDPVRLAQVRVTARAACVAGHHTESAEVATLWDQIRTAVRLVALQAEDSGAVRPDVRRFVTHLDTNARTVLAHTVLPRERGRPRPFGALPPESLSAGGYVRYTDSVIVYAVPNEASLLSDAFEADHCFGAIVGADSAPGLVGLTFAPVGGRPVPDVAGVLWADTATSALRSLEFTYVDSRLPDIARGPGRAGGSVHFATLPNGQWATVGWRLRTPESVTTLAADGRAAVRLFERSGLRWRADAARWQFVDVGAVATRAHTSDSAGPRAGARASDSAGDDAGDQAGADGALARLRARVRDGSAAVLVRDALGRPVPGAVLEVTQRFDPAAAGFVVSVAGAHLVRARLSAAHARAVTDSDGVARVAALPPGHYLTHLVGAALDSAGVEPPVSSLVVRPDTLAELAIAPPALAALTTRCPRRAPGDTTTMRLVYGIVVDDRPWTARAGESERPAEGARVTARWNDGAGVRRGVRRVRTDAAGAFVVCDLPATADVRIAAEGPHGERVAEEQALATGVWRAAYARLGLHAPGDNAGVDRAGPRPGMVVVAGSVQDSVTGAAFAGATVDVVEAAQVANTPRHVVADAAGVFRLPALPPGRYLVQFTHPLLDAYGIEPETGIADLRPSSDGVMLRLAGPGPSRVLAALCGAAEAGVLVGQVRDTVVGVSVDGDHVHAEWTAGHPADTYVVDAAVASSGWFHVCGPPRGQRVTLTVERPDGVRTGLVDVVIPPSGVAVRDLAIPPTAAIRLTTSPATSPAHP